MGIYSLRTQEYLYYPCGYFTITESSTVYDAVTNTLTLNLSDLMAELNGARNGQIGGAPTILIPVENEDGTKNIIRDAVSYTHLTKGGTGAATAAAALKNLGITASAEELNILSGATVTAEELNSLKDATDGIQSQLDEKASAASLNSHTGNTAVHISTAERTNWNLAKTHADTAHARTDAKMCIRDSYRDAR